VVGIVPSRKPVLLCVGLSTFHSYFDVLPRWRSVGLGVPFLLSGFPHGGSCVFVLISRAWPPHRFSVPFLERGLGPSVP
jgi:hypothetical protein